MLLGVAKGRIDDVAGSHVGKRRGLGYDALVASAGRALVQHAARHHLHPHACALRLAQNVVDQRVPFCTLSAMNTFDMGTPVRSASMTGRLPSMKSAM